MQSNYCLVASAQRGQLRVRDRGGAAAAQPGRHHPHRVPAGDIQHPRQGLHTHQHGDHTPLSSAGVAATGLPRHPALLLHPAHQGHGALGVPLPRPLRSV